MPALSRKIKQRHVYQPCEIVARLERDAAARGKTIKDRLTEILDTVLPRLPDSA